MPQLPPPSVETSDPDDLLGIFEEYCAELGLTLYPAQEEAILSVAAGENTVVATPTGSGKSMVALAALFFARSTGRRAFYTAPIKALVSEKFFALSEVFGADAVGMVTGDSAVNPDADIICATAEILANQALRSGSELDVGLVVMDEFHFYADPQRGWAWQVPLIEMPQAQFVLMSATLGDMTRIGEALEATTGRETAQVTSVERPVPLDFSYREHPLGEVVQELVRGDRAPVYIVSFAQNQAVEVAAGLMGTALTEKEAKDAIAERIRGFSFSKGFGQILRRFLLHGIGVHHAGMLPKYRRLVEHLAAEGLLTVISGTDTLGVGINVPIRTVLLSGLAKFDGSRMRRLRVREFQQIAGRAGRAGFDAEGHVVALAPEHVIENARALAKAGDDPKKRKKVVRKKAPAGFVSWSEETFAGLTTNPPEELGSRMRMTHAMVLNLLSRPHAGVDTVRDFIDRTLEPEAGRVELRLQALRIGRSLLEAEVIERHPVDGRIELRVVEDLGAGFALNQPLSPFALAALDLFDAESPDDALDVLSIIEAVTPAPAAILRGQLDRIKKDELGRLKAEGVEYTERMAILDELDVPRPNAELLHEAFDAYAAHAPWVRASDLEPKAIVRAMIDEAMNFSQFVAYNSLARFEGGLLRYLSDVYRALLQNVPAERVGERLEEIRAWLGDLIGRVDSSLLQEWEALRLAGDAEVPGDLAPPAAQRFTADERRFTAAVRNTLFHRVLLAERADYESLGRLDAESGFDARRWEDAIEDFYEEYGELRIDAEARGGAHVRIERGAESWEVRQTLVDPEGDHDWAIRARIDLAASDESEEPVVRILSVGPLTAGA